MSVVVIVVIGRYLTKSKPTVAICDSGFYYLQQSKCTYGENVRHLSHFCFYLLLTSPA